MIHLATCFFHVNCVDGVEIVANLISTYFKFMARSRCLIQGETNDPIMDFVILLEQDPRTSSHERMQSFVDLYYTNISTSRRIRMLSDVDENRELRMSKTTRKILTKEMAKTLSVCYPTDGGFSHDEIMELLAFFVRRRKFKRLASYTSKICEIPTDSAQIIVYNSMIDSLVQHKCDDVMKLASLSEQVKSTFSSLLVYRVPKLLLEITIGVQHSTKHTKMLSNHLKFYKQLIQGDAPPREKDLIAITSSLSLLTISQQLHLIVEMYEFNGSSLNQDVGVRQYLRQMANVLHVTLELNPSEVPLALFNLDVLKCFAALGNHSIVVLMGDCLRAVVAPSESSTKHKLFQLVLTDLLALLDGTDKYDILQICGQYLRDLVKGIDTDSPAPDYPNNLINGFHYLMQLETSDLTVNHDNVAATLKDVFTQLRPNVLLDTMLDVHLWQAKYNIKKLPTSLEAFTALCCHYVKGEFISTACKSVSTLTQVLRCLLWLDDEPCWESFANGICQSFLTDNVTPFADLVHKTFQEPFMDSPSALKAFNAVVDFAEDRVKHLSQLDWKQVHSSLPDYPEIEAFLHSDRMTMVYENTALFRSLADARKFASDLAKLAQTNGFHVTVTATGASVRSSCVITKQQIVNGCSVEFSQYHDREFRQLIDTRNHLNVAIKKRRLTNSPMVNNEYVLFSSKRAKMDRSLLNIKT